MQCAIMVTTLWTVGLLLQETARYLKKKGIPSARLDAELLLADCLGRERIDLYLDYDYPLSAQELSSFREHVRRRGSREPVAYILGHKEFWSLKLHVSRGLLIPRPETEMLVETVLEQLHEMPGDTLHVLEIGTGSGAIAAALCVECDRVRVYACDISRPALLRAKENCGEHSFSDRVHFVQCDGIEPLRRCAAFDVVVSNPPYVPLSVIDRLEPEIRDFEPHAALDGGADGLRFYRAWVPELSGLIRPGGLAAFEIGHEQGEAVSDIFREAGCYKRIQVRKDYAGYDRIVSAHRM